MRLSILVPWRDGGCRYRSTSLDLVVRHLASSFPGASLSLVDDGGEVWSRGQSIDMGVRESDCDLFLVHDADGLIPTPLLVRSVQLALLHPGLVIPYSSYHYLSEEESSRAFASWPDDMEFSPIWTLPDSVGGAGAFTRSTHQLARGHDPRFRGWGAQDKQFYVSCSTLVGPTRHLPGVFNHLYHPIDKTNNPSLSGYKSNMALRDRYFAAMGDPEALWEVMSEREDLMGASVGI